MDIYSDISSIDGVGKKTQEKFNKLGIFTVLDLLLYFPRDYTFLNVDILNINNLNKGKSISPLMDATAVIRDLLVK